MSMRLSPVHRGAQTSELHWALLVQGAPGFVPPMQVRVVLPVLKPILQVPPAGQSPEVAQLPPAFVPPKQTPAARATSEGKPPAAFLTWGLKTPAPTPRKIDTSLEAPLATARSTFPSPFRSAAAIAWGRFPVRRARRPMNPTCASAIDAPLATRKKPTTNCRGLEWKRRERLA